MSERGKSSAENNDVLVWSYKEKGSVKADKSFICLSAGGNIIKRNKNTSKNVSFNSIIEDIWKGKDVIREAKIKCGYSATKEEIMRALEEMSLSSLDKDQSFVAKIRNKENDVVLMKLQVSELKKELETSEREGLLSASHVKDLKEKILDLQNTREEKTVPINITDAKEETLVPINVTDACKAVDFRKELQTSQSECFRSQSLTESLKEKIIDLTLKLERAENAVKFSVVKLKEEMEKYVAYVVETKNLELENSITRREQLQIEVKDLQKQLHTKEKLITTYEEERGSLSSVTRVGLEVARNQSELILAKESEYNAMELKSEQLKKDLGVYKSECYKSGNLIGDLKKKIVDLEENLIASALTAEDSNKKTLEEQIEKTITCILEKRDADTSLVVDTSLTESIGVFNKKKESRSQKKRGSSLRGRSSKRHDRSLANNSSGISKLKKSMRGRSLTRLGKTTPNSFSGRSGSMSRLAVDTKIEQSIASTDDGREDEEDSQLRGREEKHLD